MRREQVSGELKVRLYSPGGPLEGLGGLLETQTPHVLLGRLLWQGSGSARMDQAAESIAHYLPKQSEIQG